MKKLYLTLIFILALAFALAICASADYGVYDDIGILSPSEEGQINEALRDASEYTGISFYAGTVNNADHGYSFLSKHNLDDSNTIILLIDIYNGNYSYVTHTFGSAQNEFSIDEENEILDSFDVYSNIKSGKLAEGICSFAEQAKEACAPAWGTLIGVSVVAVLVASGIFLLIVIPKYKKKQRGASYPFDRFTAIEVTDCSDVFVTKTVTRYRYRSSSSSGSSRSGGSRSGGSRSSSRR